MLHNGLEWAKVVHACFSRDTGRVLAPAPQETGAAQHLLVQGSHSSGTSLLFLNKKRLYVSNWSLQCQSN